MNADIEDYAEGVAGFLKSSTKILVFTGAGISTASGIPDYRGPKGFWKTHRPVYFQEFMSSEEARKEYWSQKLSVWENFKNAKPTNTHYSIVDLEKAGKLLMVVTQNVDGLHRIAGTSPEKLVELHGTNRLVECMSCHKMYDPDPYFEEFRKTGIPPKCECGGFLKPATISFGQSLKEEDLKRAFWASDNCDFVIALGSTLSVTPASEVPLAAASRGIPYVIINSGPTEHDNLPQVTMRIDGDVQRIFPLAVRKTIGSL